LKNRLRTKIAIKITTQEAMGPSFCRSQINDAD
jgi:hypothetical protein